MRQHQLQWQPVGLAHTARGGEVAKASAAHKVRNQGIRAGYYTALLPQHRVDWRSTPRLSTLGSSTGQRSFDPLDQRFAACRMPDPRCDLADLHEAGGHGVGNAQRLDPHPQPRKRASGGWRQERARDYHIGVQRDHFLGRAASGAEAARDRKVHRRRARILAVAGDRGDLAAISHLGQHRIAAWIKADHHWVDQRGQRFVRKARATAVLHGRQHETSRT